MKNKVIEALEAMHPGYKVVAARVSTKDGAIDSLSDKLTVEMDLELVDAVKGAKDLDLVELCSSSGYPVVTKEEMLLETLSEEEYLRRLSSNILGDNRV